MGSLRDSLLIARFEVLRAVRTWRALALIVLHLVAASGGAYLFTRLIGLLENAAADQLGVPTTETPGAMLDTLLQGDQLQELLGAMVGSEHLVAQILDIPVLAIFHLWMGFLILPFFGASASAESVAIDVQSGAVRYEVLRTGRLELVLGRLLGQLALTLVASALSVGGVWAVGMWFMVGNDPLELAAWLGWLTLRAWAFAVPFVGLGVACSQLTSSPAWARVLAVAGTAGSWVAFGFARWAESAQHTLVADLALQLLPQGWMRGLWEPGLGWVPAATVCLVLGVAMAALGFARFARRDL